MDQVKSIRSAEDDFRTRSRVKVDSAISREMRLPKILCALMESAKVILNFRCCVDEWRARGHALGSTYKYIQYIPRLKLMLMIGATYQKGVDGSQSRHQLQLVSGSSRFGIVPSTIFVKPNSDADVLTLSEFLTRVVLQGLCFALKKERIFDEFEDCSYLYLQNHVRQGHRSSGTFGHVIHKIGQVPSVGRQKIANVGFWSRPIEQAAIRYFSNVQSQGDI